MPGFVSHYLFGVESFRQLDDKNLKKNIRRFCNAYNLGLQGPDLFFYFLPTTLGILPNIANMMHKKNTNDFFANLIDGVSSVIDETDYLIALAYIEGFAGHYVLDTACHPYIYGRVGTKSDQKTLGVHFGLETDIDRELLLKYRQLPLEEFSHQKVIRLSMREKRVISQLLHGTIFNTYGVTISNSIITTAMNSIGLASSILMDRTQFKQDIWGFVEKRVLGYEVLSPLLINTRTHSKDPCNVNHINWTNPWDKSYTCSDSFFELFEKNIPRYVAIMKSINRAVYDSYLQLGDDFSDTLDLIGNLSYSSGLDCGIELIR